MLTMQGMRGVVVACREVGLMLARGISGVVSIARALGLDGVDFDVENRAGDLIVCAAILQRVVDKVHAAGLQVTFAPQLVRRAGGGRAQRFVH